MSRRKISLRVFLSLALLFAQFGAIAHAYTHSRYSPGQIGVPADQAQLCSQCQSGAPLLAAADCASFDFELCPAQCEATVQSKAVSLIDASARHSFQSRAPPHLL
jgi:hypothetical protein